MALRAVEQRMADPAQRTMLAAAREEVRVANCETRQLLWPRSGALPAR